MILEDKGRACRRDAAVRKGDSPSFARPGYRIRSQTSNAPLNNLDQPRDTPEFATTGLQQYLAMHSGDERVRALQRTTAISTNGTAKP